MSSISKRRSSEVSVWRLGCGSLSKLDVNRKRVARLMQRMGLEAVYPKPKLSRPGEGHELYPYLLKNVSIERVNQVWSTDITYIRLARGFCYLVAVMDWHSRFVLSWSLLLTRELEFCLEAWASALRGARPEIFNSDQGSQFTSKRFTDELERRGIAISMDGRGRCFDNLFIERLWRSLKHEEIYLNEYERVSEARCASNGGLSSITIAGRIRVWATGRRQGFIRNDNGRLLVRTP